MEDQNLPTKQYGLKDVEQRYLQALQAQYAQAQSLYLSFISMERLAYNVTENTEFRVDGPNLTIIEHTAQDTPSVSVSGEEPAPKKGKK
jgi:hypothetical protein